MLKSHSHCKFSNPQWTEQTQCDLQNTIDCRGGVKNCILVCSRLHLLFYHFLSTDLKITHWNKNHISQHTYKVRLWYKNLSKVWPLTYRHSNSYKICKKCASLPSSTIYSIINMNQKQKLITWLFYRNGEAWFWHNAGKIQSSPTGAQQV